MIRQINQVPDASGAGYYNPCSGALSIVMPSEAINQVMNPSFELYNTAYTGGVPFVGWTATRRVGGSTTTTTNISAYITAGNPVWSGANAFYTANAGTTGDFVSLTYSAITLAQTKYFALSFYIYGASGSNGRAYTTRVLNGATVVAQKGFTLIEGQWQRVELVFLSPIATSTATFVIEKSSVSGSWAGGNAYIDAVQFEQVAAPDTDIGIGVASMHATTYFDGDTEGTIDDSTGVYEYAWQGTPHRSRSVRYATTASGGRVYNLQDEFGLEIIGIAEAGINQPQVQAIQFGSQDGGALQDIINPVRTVTLIGQLAGANKVDLSRKIQRLQALLSRDLFVNRQDRTFIFQHYDGREALGVPMTFRGAFSGGLNVLVTDALTVNVDISVQMHDPYFYGHDEALRVGPEVVSSNGIFRVSQYDTDSKTTMLEAIATGLNGSIRTVAQAPDGRVWIGGSFTQSNIGQSLPYICIWNPATNTFSAVPGPSLANPVNIIKFDRNNTAWIGGEFASFPGGNYLTTHDGTGYIFTGNFNNIIDDIEIVNTGSGFDVIAVGAFTASPSGAALRMAIWQNSLGFWAPFAGANARVRAVVYSPVEDAFYVGGQFTAIGISVTRLAKISRSGSVTSIGSTLNAPVRDLYIDADGTLIIGGEFTSPFTYLAYYANGGFAQFPGFGGGLGPSGVFPVEQSIFGYKGGIFVGAPKEIPSAFLGTNTLLPSMSYWNGTALSGSAWIPIAGSTYSQHVGMMLSDGTLMVGLYGGTSFDISRTVTHSANQSTIQSYPTIRIVFDGNPVQLSAVINVRDDKVMVFTDRTQGDSTTDDVDFIASDLVTIKPKYGTVQSALFGNLIQLLNLAGTFSDFTLRPGVVSISSVINTDAANSIIEVYWRQTFQSIFDGVSKS